MEEEYNEVESRYAHLLQPIRDLAQNWNIDIASELEEYLSELENITFTFDGSEKRLNFAEAALLIQGSACVYSKKVEYLYQLLFQTLDFLMERKKRQQKSSIGEDGQDKDVPMEEPEQEFLTLDDIEEANNIDLVEEGNKNTNRDEDDDDLLNPSATLAWMIHRQATEEQTGIGARRTDFRINTCAIHSSGALLLDERDQFAVNESLQRVTTNTSSPSKESSNPANSVAIVDKRDIGPIVMGGRLDDDSDDEDNRLGGFPMIIDPTQSSGMVAPNGTQLNDSIGSITITEKNAATNTSGDTSIDQLKTTTSTLESDKTTEEKKKAETSDEEKDKESEEEKSKKKEKDSTSNSPIRKSKKPRREVDDWAMMDPHEPASSKLIRPFKKGKTYRIPSCLKENSDGKKKETPENNQNDTRNAQAIEKQKTIGYSLRGCFYIEFDYILKRVHKLRQLQRRKWKEDIIAETFEDATPTQRAYAMEEHQEEVNEEQAIEFNFGGGGFTMNDSDDDEPDNFSSVPPMALEDGGGLCYNNLSVGSDSNDLITSYEDLCKTHVENFLASAASYIQETAISQRISEWTKRITPVLEEQDKRPSFDIHVYSDKIINRFDQVGEKKNVEQLLGGEESYETCRNFVAALQLANWGNVEILPASKKAINGLDFKLLSRNKVYDFDNYTIPSQNPISQSEQDSESLEDEEQLVSTQSKRKQIDKDRDSPEEQEVDEEEVSIPAGSQMESEITLSKSRSSPHRKSAKQPITKKPKKKETKSSSSKSKIDMIEFDKENRINFNKRAREVLV